MNGRVVYLYGFDVADEIATDRVGEILSARPFPCRIRTDRTVPKEVFLHPPLAISTPPRECDSSEGRITVRPAVKIFDVGAISISIEVPFEGRSLADLVRYHSIALAGGSVDAMASGLCGDVVRSLRPAMIRAGDLAEPSEAYTVFCIADPEDPRGEGVPGWLEKNRRAIAALLNEEDEPSRLAASQVDEATRLTLSYSTSDGVVVDWDAALVVDREGAPDDVLHVVELANVQLLEFQFLDRRLDRLLDRAYDDLDRFHRRPRVLRLPGKTLQGLRRLQIDLTKISDEVTNIAKFSGDWYLARLYVACRERFHLDRWREGVQRKLAILEHLYNLVRAETNERRMLILEALIVLLFVVDLVALAFFGR